VAAAPEDLETIMRLDRAVFGVHAYPQSVVRQLYALFAPLTLLALDPHGEPVGFAFGALGLGGEGWILALGVLGGRRENRIGKALTVAQLECLVAHGAASVRLTVDPENLPAMTLYESTGFRVVESVDDYLGPGRDRVILERTL
jgi:ribosomal protein S18 acetylase RimI-like enzyme